MNICLVSKEYSPTSNYGGIGTYTYNLAQGLAGLGNNVHVISYAQDKETEYMDKKVFVHRIKENTPILRSYFPESILYSIRVAKKINKIINSYNIQIVEFPNWLAEGFWFSLRNPRKRRIPCVTRIHTTHFQTSEITQKTSLRDKFICLLEKIAILRSDSLVTSTDAHKKIVLTKYKISTNRIKIVPLGLENVVSKEICPDTANNNGFNTVLFVGRLQERKGIHILLEAIPQVLRRYPKTVFNIIGKDYKERSQNLFNEKYGSNFSSNVNFLGSKSDEELQRYYRTCDIFVAPSLYESFGLVYLEAMQYGKPVIGCKVGGVPEVVEDGKTGILVSSEDSNALSESIIYLLENKNIRFQMGKDAFNRVRKYYSLEKMVSSTLDLYSETIETFRKSHIQRKDQNDNKRK